jgi:hypothetical protein
MEDLSTEDYQWVIETYRKERTTFCAGQKDGIEQARCTLEQFKERFAKMLSQQVFPAIEERLAHYAEEMDFNPAELVFDEMFDAEQEEALLFYLRTKQWQLTPSELAEDDMRGVAERENRDRARKWNGTMVMMRADIPQELRNVVLAMYDKVDSWDAFQYVFQKK